MSGKYEQYMREREEERDICACGFRFCDCAEQNDPEEVDPIEEEQYKNGWDPRNTEL